MNFIKTKILRDYIEISREFHQICKLTIREYQNLLKNNII